MVPHPFNSRRRLATAEPHGVPSSSSRSLLTVGLRGLYQTEKTYPVTSSDCFFLLHLLFYDCRVSSFQTGKVLLLLLLLLHLLALSSN